MTTSRPLRTALVAAVSAAALVAAGCGDKHAIVTEADVEGIYLDVGQLDYQVQISRQLNPAIKPDDAYIAGLPEDLPAPAEDETWFGVFIRVQNQTREAHRSATGFEIVDTQGNTFEPVEVDAERNPFVYQPQTLEPRSVLPAPDSVQALDSGQGAMLLFKLPLTAYQSRPLELKISAPGEEPAEATVDLDL